MLAGAPGPGASGDCGAAGAERRRVRFPDYDIDAHAHGDPCVHCHCADGDARTAARLWPAHPDRSARHPASAPAVETAGGPPTSAVATEWLRPTTRPALQGHGLPATWQHRHLRHQYRRRYSAIVDLEIGDELILYVDKTPYHYTVTQKEPCVRWASA